MAKANTEIVHLVSTAGTGYFYTVRKSRKKDKLELKKYDPVARQHVVFNEKKLSKAKK